MRNSKGQFCSTKKRIAYLATADDWVMTVKRIEEKLFELIDSVNSLLEEKEKVEHYIWTGEYEGEGTATYGEPKKEIKAIIYDKDKQEWRGILGPKQEPKKEKCEHKDDLGTHFSSSPFNYKHCPMCGESFL